jgi:myosin heavy subunit
VWDIVVEVNFENDIVYFIVNNQGNLEFAEDSDKAQIANENDLQIIAQLLDVDKSEAEKALCARVVAARGEVMEKGHTVEEAVHGRDAFAKVFINLGLGNKCWL